MNPSPMNPPPMNPNHSLFADMPLYKYMGEGLYRGRGRVDLVDLWPLALLCVVAAIAIVAIVKIRKRNDMDQPCNDPIKLFRELSLAHNLDRASQNLLWRLTEVLQLAQPAEIFLQPAYFHADNLPPELREAEAELDALRQRLF